MAGFKKFSVIYVFTCIIRFGSQMSEMHT